MRACGGDRRSKRAERESKDTKEVCCFSWRLIIWVVCSPLACSLAARLLMYSNVGRQRKYFCTYLNFIIKTLETTDTAQTFTFLLPWIINRLSTIHAFTKLCSKLLALPPVIKISHNQPLSRAFNNLSQLLKQ